MTAYRVSAELFYAIFVMKTCLLILAACFFPEYNLASLFAL